MCCLQYCMYRRPNDASNITLDFLYFPEIYLYIHRCDLSAKKLDYSFFSPPIALITFPLAFYSHSIRSPIPWYIVWVSIFCSLCSFVYVWTDLFLSSRLSCYVRRVLKRKKEIDWYTYRQHRKHVTCTSHERTDRGIQCKYMLTEELCNRLLKYHLINNIFSNIIATVLLT